MNVALRALFACMLLVSGCYQTADELTVDEFVDGYAEQYCRRIFECCDAEELERHPHGDGDLEECVFRQRTGTGIYLRSILADESVVYDPIAARECLAALRHGECGDRTEWSAVCLGVTRPLIEEGGACSTTLECTTFACMYPGTCIQPRQEGEPCEVGEAGMDWGYCAVPMRCDPDRLVCVYRLPACDGI